MGDGHHVSPSYRSSVLFSSSNSPWAVLHMPEEREQRIHYVRLSLFTQVIGRRDSGTLGGGGCACSLVAGEREVPVFVLSVLFEEQGSCLHVCFLWRNLVSPTHTRR